MYIHSSKRKCSAVSYIFFFNYLINANDRSQFYIKILLRIMNESLVHTSIGECALARSNFYHFPEDIASSARTDWLICPKQAVSMFLFVMLYVCSTRTGFRMGTSIDNNIRIRLYTVYTLFDFLRRKTNLKKKGNSQFKDCLIFYLLKAQNHIF